MMKQIDHWNASHRKLAAANETFMELVNCQENPMTREDLARNIERRPALWSRYAGFLDVLPSVADIVTAESRND